MRRISTKRYQGPESKTFHPNLAVDVLIDEERVGKKKEQKETEKKEEIIIIMFIFIYYTLLPLAAMGLASIMP